MWKASGAQLRSPMLHRVLLMHSARGLLHTMTCHDMSSVWAPYAHSAVMRTDALHSNGSSWAYWSFHEGTKSGRTGLAAFKNALWLVH